MNWFTNICSCISPHFRQNIVSYLNSNSLNRQVIQQEKVTQTSRDGTKDYEPENHIYSFAKSKSINFAKLNENSDEDSDGQTKGLKSHNKKRKVKSLNISNEYNDDKQDQNEQEMDEVMDVFWYPKMNKNQSKMSQYKGALVHKRKIFDIILQQEASAAQYDKVYDSLDEINLNIYCKLESLVKGKKINSYRFSFDIQNITINEYQKWIKQVNPKQLLPLLEYSKQLQTDSQDPSFSISHHFLKKLLVINPQHFITASKIYEVEEEQSKSLAVIVFSVNEQGQDLENEKYKRGWVHLCGMEGIETEKGVRISGYMCIQLEVSVSPNMLKQPICKQIRILAQKMICSINKSDGI